MTANAAGLQRRPRHTFHGEPTVGPVPVLLIPGGTERGFGSLRSLSERLAGHPLTSLESVEAEPAGRPDPPILASRAAACDRAVRSLSCGPAVVVGHSLGAVIAVQFAMDRPDSVAGLVLLDPTPFTDLRMMRSLRRGSGLLALPGRLPVLGRLLDRALAGVLPTADLASQPPRTTTSGLRATAAALSSLPHEGQALKRRLHLIGVPVVVVTADREVGHPMRRSHDQIAEALGGEVRRLPGAGHGLHLTHTSDLAAIVRGLVAALPERG